MKSTTWKTNPSGVVGEGDAMYLLHRSKKFVHNQGLSSAVFQKNLRGVA
jgi:hypothetical protein